MGGEKCIIGIPDHIGRRQGMVCVGGNGEPLVKKETTVPSSGKHNPVPALLTC